MTNTPTFKALFTVLFVILTGLSVTAIGAAPSTHPGHNH